MHQVAALESSVLVLNKFFMALHVISAKRAFVLLCKESAEVISVDDGNSVLTISKPGKTSLSTRQNQVYPMKIIQAGLELYLLKLKYPRLSVFCFMKNFRNPM